MVRVLLAKPAGFCFGVERAIRLAKSGRARFGSVWTLGELVHNPLVLEELEKQGIRAARGRVPVQAKAVVVRAHGGLPDVVERARARGLAVIDATCPYVRKVQTVARSLAEEGYLPVVVGQRDHPEVKSILAHCQGRGQVYSARMSFRSATEDRYRFRLGVVAQTTVDRQSFQQAVARLAQLRYTEIRVFDTICKEVIARQEAAARIARRADVVVVVGGRNSANTLRLAAIARSAGRRVVHIERASELPAWCDDRKQTVGVIAGSSTPLWVVRDILRRLQNSSQGGP